MTRGWTHPVLSFWEKSKLLMLAFLLCGTTAYVIIWRDLNQAEQQFQQDTARSINIFAQRIGNAEAALKSLVGLFHATNNLSETELVVLTHDILDAYPYIDAIVHLPLIRRAERQAFEQSMEEAGFPGFQIRESRGDDRLSRSTERAKYFPIKFLDPMEPTSAKLIGWNAYSDKAFAVAIDQAIDSGAAAISAPFLVTATCPRRTMAVKAVYQGYVMPRTAAERREQLSGIVGFQLNLDEIIAGALPLNTGQHIRFYTQQENGNADIVHFEHAPNETGSILQSLLKPLVFNHRLKLEEQMLSLDVIAPISFSPIHFRLIGFLWFLFILLVLSFGYTLRNRRVLALQEKQAQDEIFEAKEKAEVTLHSIGDAVITTDIHGHVEYLNPVAEQLIGITPEASKGQRLEALFSLVNERDGSCLPSPVKQCLSARELPPVGEHALLLRKDGESISIDVSATAIHKREGDLVGAVLVLRDVSMERQLVSQMAYQATHDALTGLLNRREFEHQVDLAIRDARTHHSEHTLCFLDLDQFKFINDSVGHIAGDKLLKQLASSLAVHIRKSDLLARLGGDEFGLLLRNCSPIQGHELAQALCSEIKDIYFHWEDKTFSVGASVGIVHINQYSGNLTELLSAADSACYIAKELGRNRTHIYQDDDAEVSRRRGEIQTLHQIQTALRNNKLSLCLQLIKPLSRGAEGQEMYECLVRMKDGAGQSIPPGAFIPVAERYGLMKDVDYWVLSNAFRIIKTRLLICEQAGIANPPVYTINLSGQSLNNPDLKGYVEKQLREYQVDPKFVCFEITETAVIANLDQALDIMNSLKDLGCRFALDDFGTGLSSFAYLKKLPVDFLKIDGEFVRDMLSDPVDQAMVETINNIGHVLHIKTVAEYVETPELLEKLQAMDVDFAQGYHIGYPEPETVHLAPVPVAAIS